jgi:hypothetical protein
MGLLFVGFMGLRIIIGGLAPFFIKFRGKEISVTLVLELAAIAAGCPAIENRPGIGP